MVTGFKMKSDDTAVVLIGSKAIDAIGGRMSIETSAVPMDSTSSYRFAEILKSDIENARNEVALYKNGNCVPVNKDNEEPPAAFDFSVKAAEGEEQF